MTVTCLQGNASSLLALTPEGSTIAARLCGGYDGERKESTHPLHSASWDREENFYLQQKIEV